MHTEAVRRQNKTPLVVGYPYRMLHRKDEKRSPYILLPWMHQRYPALRKLACKQRFYNSFCSTYVCYEENIGYTPCFVKLNHQLQDSKRTRHKEKDRKSTRLNSSHTVISYAV